MNFFRTLGGKILLFAACLVFAAMTVASGIGAIFLVDQDFYSNSEAELFSDAIREPMLSAGNDILNAIIWTNTPDETPKDIGNLAYYVEDENGEILVMSESMRGDEALQKAIRHKLKYWVRSHGQTDKDIFSEWDISPDEIKKSDTPYTICFALKKGLPEQDAYRLLWQGIHLGYTLRYWIFAIVFASLVLSVICFILLMNVSARKPGTQELVPGLLHRVPFDLLVVLYLIPCMILGYGVGSIFDDWIMLMCAVPLCLLYAGLGLGLCMSAAARIKTKTLLRNTVIYRLCRLLWHGLRRLFRLLRKLPMVWRTALILLGISFAEFIGLLCFDSSREIAVLWFLEKLIVIPLVLVLALGLRRLQKGAEALAAGNLDYRTEETGLFWEFKRHARNLNSIALGMNAAVEQRMRSERMKTELITNVSHDLKTPLTSVVNYADLISREPCENAKITEYSKVLTRQADRLKRLIEDLVEASKASTGNLEVNPVLCDATVFLTQAAGEYEQKLAAANLHLITKCPEEPVMMLADGRRMWRIFDNLMNNICKYALPGTRVYLSLETMGDKLVITFKNTSRQQLDISESELMERFVRGDGARSTEGNGLGLSIARSLTELQGGTLRLFIDGDLFKAMLIFPKQS